MKLATSAMAEGDLKMMTDYIGWGIMDGEGNSIGVRELGFVIGDGDWLGQGCTSERP